MPSRAERRRREKSATKAAIKGEADPVARRRRTQVLVAVGILALAGVVGFLALNADRRDCPGHWHATFAVYIDDERLPFPQPPYSMDREGGEMPMSLHMHRPNQELLHFEPSSPRCVGVGPALRSIDVRLEPGELRLEGAHSAGPMGGTYRDDGNRTLRVFIEGDEGLQERPVRDVLGYQLRDGEKLLVAYGSYTQDEVEDLMDRIGEPSG